MTPAGTSNELDVQNEWEENTHTHTCLFFYLVTTGCFFYISLCDNSINQSNQSICFSMREGDECAIVGDLDEETALLGGSFIERRVPASARKKFFSNPRNLKAYSFKPGG